MLDASNIREEFSRFNGFYKAANARQIIYDLYKGKCAATGRKIDLAEADIGHIIPQSDPGSFEKMFPGLDVHNIINLQLLKASENRKVGNTYAESPLLLATAFAYTIRLVRTRYHKVAKSRPSRQFDPEYWLERLTHRHKIDYSASLAAIRPYKNYFLISQETLNEDLRASLKGTELEKPDAGGLYHFGYRYFPSKNIILTHVEGSQCISVEVMTNTALKEVKEHILALSDELFRKRGYFLRRDKDSMHVERKALCDIPDGKWMILSQKQPLPTPVGHISLIEPKHRPMAMALRVLRDRESRPAVVEKAGPDSIIQLTNASSIFNLLMSAQFHEEADSQTEAVDLDFPITFQGSGFGRDGDLDRLRSKIEGHRGNRGAIIRRKDYASLMQRLKKAVIQDLKAEGFIE